MTQMNPDGVSVPTGRLATSLGGYAAETATPQNQSGILVVHASRVH